MSSKTYEFHKRKTRNPRRSIQAVRWASRHLPLPGEEGKLLVGEVPGADCALDAEADLVLVRGFGAFSLVVEVDPLAKVV